MVSVNIKKLLLSLVTVLVPTHQTMANPDLNFTIEDSRRYPIEGHAGSGVFEAKPSNACLGLNLNEMAYWCSTVSRNKIVKNTIVLIGDSKTTYIFPGFVRNAKNSNLILIARPSCPPIKDVKFSGVNDRQNLDKCELLSKVAANTIANDKDVTHVFVTFGLRTYNVLAGRTTFQGNENSKDGYSAALADFIRTITSKGKHLIFLIDNPNLTASEKCFPRASYLSENHRVPGCVIPKTEHLKAMGPIYEMISMVKERTSSKYFHIYDFTDDFCPNNLCSVKRNNQYLYELVDHLTDFSNDIVSKKIVTDFKLGN